MSAAACPTRASPTRSIDTRAGSGAHHGRRGAEPPRRSAAAVAVWTAMASSLVGGGLDTAGSFAPWSLVVVDVVEVRCSGRARTDARSRRDGAPDQAIWRSVRPGRAVRTSARPGRSRSRWAASLTPSTSRLSSSSATRRQIRSDVLARMASVMTPAGRCVASTRWMPRLRPRWATSTTPSMKPGTSRISVANSSTATTSAGSGGAPLRSRCSRRRSSASSDCTTRSASPPSRSVTSPTLCGRSSRSPNAVPPL